MDLQFYPTPRTLAVKAVNKFQNKSFTAILEPSAGNGDLLSVFDGLTGHNATRHAIEIDMEKHPLLREKGFTVVGMDFMEFEGGSLYSHILMNPPFAQGVNHVLHAWNLLFHGELVAIINAESIKNPFSKERQLLCSLIKKHGSVEFLQSEFETEETKRKTSVEIALIHMVKEADPLTFSLDLDELKKDKMSPSGLTTGFTELNSEIALRGDYIEIAVNNFNLAVKSAREFVFAEYRFDRYKSLLGQTMADTLRQSNGVPKINNLSEVITKLNKIYDDLKDRAWWSILRSTEVQKKLSSGAARTLESRFSDVRSLEFTAANIYGFLLGLVNHRSAMNLEMCLEVFDSITRYHSDNAVHYMGWKSNDKHIKAARRIKMTRFILPGFGNDGWRTQLGHNLKQRLLDFDKVFAMLDGKELPSFGLADLFDARFKDLAGGERLASDYFEVRYYPGVGTIHFFPRNKKLIDRLNRLVGRARQWLPHEDEAAGSGFWNQYEQAEKFAKTFDRNLTDIVGGQYFEPHIKEQYGNSSDKEKATTYINEAMAKTLADHGIDPVAILLPQANSSEAKTPILSIENKSGKSNEQLTLLAA